MVGIQVALVCLGAGICGRPTLGLLALQDPSALRSISEDTLVEVWRKMDVIDAVLYARADPILRDGFENGFAEPAPPPWSGGCGLAMDIVRDREDRWNRETIFARRIVRGRELEVVLDRLDFPALYALKDESIRLRRIADAMLRKYRAPPWCGEPLASDR